MFSTDWTTSRGCCVLGSGSTKETENENARVRQPARNSDRLYQRGQRVALVYRRYDGDRHGVSDGIGRHSD